MSIILMISNQTTWEELDQPLKDAGYEPVWAQNRKELIYGTPFGESLILLDTSFFPGRLAEILGVLYWSKTPMIGLGMLHTIPLVTRLRELEELHEIPRPFPMDELLTLMAQLINPS